MKKKFTFWRAIKYITIALFILIATIITYGFTFGYKRLVKVEYKYDSPQIPMAFDGYRIIHISDLHVGTLKDHIDVIEKFVDIINEEDADLIVFTGDMVNRQSSELIFAKEALSALKARNGVVAVMGNHDYSTYYRWNNDEERLADVRKLQNMIHEMGWQLLLNEHKVLRKETDSIAIIGVENDGKPPFPALGDLAKAQNGITDSTFRILLSHDPSHWRRKVLPETNIPLTLSGHTHAMQFKVAGFSPSKWIYPEWSGIYTQDERMLIVSEGIGEVMWHFRFGAWPQYSVITLKQEQ